MAWHTRIPRIGCVACLKRQLFDMKKETKKKKKKKKKKKHWSLLPLISLEETPHYILRMKSMHLFKSYWGDTISLLCILPQQQKLSEKGHNLAKILWMITNIEFDLYITMIYPSANFQ